MNHNTYKNRTLLSSFIAGCILLSGASSYADDTEIFFAGTSNTDLSTKPNVMFILDNSGSMSENNPTKMSTLKSTFSDIMTSANNINAGLMVLNPRTAYNNQRMVYQVEDIDNLYGGVQLPTDPPEILVPADDATQITSTASARAVLNEGNLIMGSIQAPSASPSVTPLRDNAAYFSMTSNSQVYACNARVNNNGTGSVCNNSAQAALNISSDSSGREALLLFRGVNIPANATVTNARLILNASSSAPGGSMSVSLESSKTPVALNNDSLLGSSRTFTAQSGATSGTWTSGSDVAISVTTAFNALKGVAPTAAPIGDVLVKVRATSANNYSFCIETSCGTAPRLEVTYTAGSTTEYMTALRFQNVGIPQGASITSAYIEMVPASSSYSPTTLEVKAERVSENEVGSSAFTTTTDLTARTRTSATVNWTSNEWVTGNPQIEVQGPVVTSLVQEVVNQSDWCGNSAMSFYIKSASGNTGWRSIVSRDNTTGLQPTLKVTYTGGASGCINKIIETRINNPKNDGRERSVTYQSCGRRGCRDVTENQVELDGSSLSFGSTFIGARYENFPVLRNAPILEASVVLTPSSTSGTGAATIHFEDSSNPSAFEGVNDNLGDRDDDLTTGRACTLSGHNGEPVVCADTNLKSDLAAIFRKSGWAQGNAINVIIKPTSNSNLSIKAYEDNPSESIRLRLKVKSGYVGTLTKVRNHLNSLVQDMNASGGTPLVPAMYDAARYLTALASKHSGPESPITVSCQSTHIVLLTDGQPDVDNDITRQAITDVGSLIGSSCGSDYSDAGASNFDEACGRSLAHWLRNTDQSDFDGDNRITTHTIGFGLANNAGATRFLADMAANGGGLAKTAENASQLSAAFNAILQSVIASETTFVSANAPVNSFNRQDNKDELYFSLFKPQLNDRWIGNLKRYRLAITTTNGTTTAAIVDADNRAAINSQTNFFDANARSFWTPAGSPDGSAVGAGGAAGRVPSATSRNLFTFVDDTPPSSSSPVVLTGANYLLKAENTRITRDHLNAASDTERAELLSFIRTPPDGTIKIGLGDPLHSAPRLATYACNSYSDNERRVCTSEVQMAVIGTNEGFVQGFTTSDGVEQFGFMPKALLRNIKLLKANAETPTTRKRPYGMDNTVTIWANDVNKNGVIFGGRDPSSTTTPPAMLSSTTVNTGEFVYAYATMGRGGRDIYALDITDRTAPKLRWVIQGGVTTGFSKLRQTWSAPIKTQIQVGAASTANPPTDVLIFTGGYNENQDNVNVRTPDVNTETVTPPTTGGNAIYIVNARTGELIWSASNDSGTLRLSNMIYSMPSSVRVIDLQKNATGTLVLDDQQLADQIFIGDMGGQIWRLYINNGNDASSLVTAGGTSNNGVFASIAGTAETSARRFYNEPDVSMLNVDGTLTLSVNIGSGYRGHPLNTRAEDRFYAFRTNVLTKPAGSEGTFTEASMYDATANLVQRGSTAEERNAAKAQLNATSGGWYIRLNAPQGEKVLTQALVASGQLFFNTYEPTATVSSCRPSAGLNRSYGVNLLDATPVTTVNGNPADRYSQSTGGGGILPPPSVYCQGSTCVLLKGGPDRPPEILPTVRLGKSYWIDKTDL